MSYADKGGYTEGDEYSDNNSENDTKREFKDGDEYSDTNDDDGGGDDGGGDDGGGDDGGGDDGGGDGGDGGDTTFLDLSEGLLLVPPLEFNPEVADPRKNIHKARLPLMSIENYEIVDPALMFYLICFYEGLYDELSISKDVDETIPDSIKRQFNRYYDNTCVSYGNKHQRYLRKAKIILNNYILKDFYHTGPQLIIRYKNEDKNYRQVLKYSPIGILNVARSLVSKYRIFKIALYDPAQLVFASTKSDHCPMSDVRPIQLAYDIFCNTMGINMFVEDTTDIRNIFDIETRKRSNIPFEYKGNKFRDTLINDILRVVSNPKIVSILPPFVETKTLNYDFDPMKGPENLSVIYYSKFISETPAIFETHASFLICDKKTNNVMVYDPNGINASLGLDAKSLKMIFKSNDIENVTENRVLGFQHYDEEGYCYYFALMFMTIFIITYTLTRIDPVVLLHCIESVVYGTFNNDEDITTLIKYFAYQCNIKYHTAIVNPDNKKVYTPLNDTYTTETKKQSLDYILSWLIVELDNVIKRIDNQEQDKYISGIDIIPLQLTDGQVVTTISIFDNIVYNDLDSIYEQVRIISDNAESFGYLVVYYECVALQLYKVYRKLGGEERWDKGNHYRNYIAK